MKVQPISITTLQQNNNQPTFNGYVDRPVIKLIRGLTQSSMDNVVREANMNSKKVSVRKLQDVKVMGDAIIEKFNHFMENLHKNSVLTFDNKRTELIIKNKNLGTDVNFCKYEPASKNTGMIDADFRRIDAYAPSIIGLSFKDLQQFNTLANVLVKAPHKEMIDQYLFNRFAKNITKQANNTSFFAGLKTKRNGKKADKLAPEFNQPTGWLGKLLEIRNKAVLKEENAKKLAREQKMLEKENSKIADSISKK